MSLTDKQIRDLINKYSEKRRVDGLHDYYKGFVEALNQFNKYLIVYNKFDEDKRDIIENIESEIDEIDDHVNIILGYIEELYREVENEFD